MKFSATNPVRNGVEASMPEIHTIYAKHPGKPEKRIFVLHAEAAKKVEQLRREGLIARDPHANANH
ncbi:MAG: hypothetical protein NTW60_04315 [Candidatus Wolfebacteria bacterium]|nr:hypothetical protein [Candidatus Wolfebacteria bacterium]